MQKLQPVRYLALFGREQVAVYVQCGTDILMPQPFGYQQGRESHLYQQACVAVPEIVDPDPGHAGKGCVFVQVGREGGTAIAEYHVVRIRGIEAGHVVPDHITQERRYEHAAP